MQDGSQSSLRTRALLVPWRDHWAHASDNQDHPTSKRRRIKMVEPVGLILALVLAFPLFFCCLPLSFIFPPLWLVTLPGLFIAWFIAVLT